MTIGLLRRFIFPHKSTHVYYLVCFTQNTNTFFPHFLWPVCRLFSLHSFVFIVPSPIGRRQPVNTQQYLNSNTMSAYRCAISVHNLRLSPLLYRESSRVGAEINALTLDQPKCWHNSQGETSSVTANHAGLSSQLEWYVCVCWNHWKPTWPQGGYWQPSQCVALFCLHVYVHMQTERAALGGRKKHAVPTVHTVACLWIPGHNWHFSFAIEAINRFFFPAVSFIVKDRKAEN